MSQERDDRALGQSLNAWIHPRAIILMTKSRSASKHWWVGIEIWGTKDYKGKLGRTREDEGTLRRARY